MNLKAAEIAWRLAMEHNQLHKALTVVCKADDDEYDAVKKKFYRWIYQMIVRILEAPQADDQFREFLSRTLGEEPPYRTRRTPMFRLRNPFTRLRNLIHSCFYVSTVVKRENALARARRMEVNPPDLNKARAEILMLQDRIRQLEKALYDASIAVP